MNETYKPWLVIYRKSWTHSQTRPCERFETKEAAEAMAKEFNQHSPDGTWNHEVAVVHSVYEKVRA